ncbi:MAG TPA: alkaline phosphatase family protein [Candidatus Hydrogenedentes bacterium]|nr:alkaline phosphatase family protein [Candidatus Hydrogenedentota bacterium]HPG69179.1 alkaline phosphatase family protein [Candidatus Hydrogenedentota bacterium]
MAKRVLVIGLDCATPQFVFGPGRFDLFNLHQLASLGCWGPLRSCHPPITVPAWASMMSGKDPGSLGLYGFRNRRDHSYDALFTANARAVREPRVWDILSRHGKKVVVLGVPQTYPPQPVNGWLVSGFLAPDTRVDYTYPKTLKDEIERNVGPYILDVKDFRTDSKDRLLEQLYAMLDNRFATARYLMREKPWDFFMMVETGVDRLHHAFWKYGDPGHPKFVPGNPYASVLRDYYRAVDREIGRLMALTDDDTAILVVSDHGAKSMVGGVCVNQWLIDQGLLTLAEPPGRIARIEDCRIDWARTKAWSSGGYYARVFLNVEGREPQGIVPQADYERFRSDLAARIEAMVGPDGTVLGNKAYKPQELYRHVNGVAPDLIVYFGDLTWRSVGSVGYDSIFTSENDTGPDDANHDHYGIFIMKGGAGPVGRRTDLSLMDVAPTVLDLMGVPVPEDMQGAPIR